MVSFVRKFIIYIKNENNISNFFVRKIFNFRYNKSSNILKIKSQDELKGELLLKSMNFRSFYPICEIDSKQNYLELNTPEIKFLKFSNALIHPDSSCIIQNNVLYVNGYEDERYNEGFVKYHNYNFAKIVFNSIEYIEEGFFLAGNGSWNWYHYMIEILPKLLLLSESPKTILVSDIVQNYPTMGSVLNLFLNENTEILYLKKDTCYRVNKLGYINDFNHLQFNRFDDQILGIGTYFNPEILIKFSNHILNKIPSKEIFSERIFLYRKNTHRVASNQDDLRMFLESQGFKSVCMEELILEEQINLFRNAKFIVGISGAAWTNLIFCRNNPKAICFVPENAKEFSAFSNLSKIFNVDFFINVYKSNEHHYSNNFEIDMNEFKIKFSQLNEK